MAPLKLFGSHIPWSMSVDYLGITLDRKLTYKHHLSKIKCKFKQRRTSLQDLLCNRSTPFPPEQIFLQYLHPLITYGCPIWGAAANMHIYELQVVQNRLIMNSPRYVSRRHLHADLDVSPIHTKIRELASSFFQNIPSHSNNSIAQAANFTPGLHRHAGASANLQGIF
ncbi:RNA-directed DNA polymerase from mobile element jockey [Trichonephila clavata]|uniref:RNA-directed DNA polymerase from mobile element jockey n=1 Tax=Trichonephila clavata TaxID=2740835 RepID=A0A8X6FPH9_TRICU|nr:RNA-directed DNA polymerase from mobile element jockey [Trichonephila clavata]